MLPDDILLIIFRHHLDATPQRWSILTHICRRWQQVIMKSPLGLRLRLYCTYGTPVLKTLDCWPPLPLVINYGGSPMLSPPDPEDEDNIIAAFEQSDRVKSISLTLTNSLLEKLSTISEPFAELERLVLLSQDKMRLTLPGAFGWGECVRTLHVTGIAIPTLPRLLSSSTDLVDLQLHEIPMAGYLSPQEFANALSGASHLRSLSLHFLSFPPRRNYVGLPPAPFLRVVLPALTCFKYRGIGRYLDNFVARIDAPRLQDIDITFFNQPTIEASQLGQFIERIGLKTALTEAGIQASARAISISFKIPSTCTRLRLQIPSKQLDWQLSSMAQVCDQLSPLAFGVLQLVFDTNGWSSGQDDVHGEQYLQLIRPFCSARNILITGELTTDILYALRPADDGCSTDTPLSSLRNLRIYKPMPLDWPFWDAAQSLITSRPSCPLQFVCRMCDTGFTLQQLQEHFVLWHAYIMVCSYCDNFQPFQPSSWSASSLASPWSASSWSTSAFSAGNIDKFQKHLRNQHPEVTQTDELISQRSFTLTPLQIHALTNRHSSLREHP